MVKKRHEVTKEKLVLIRQLVHNPGKSKKVKLP